MADQTTIARPYAKALFDVAGAEKKLGPWSDALKSEAENKIKAKLISATAVDKAVAERVKQALKKRLGREVELTLEVDPSLIGGAIVRAEDMVIDGSVRTRLEQLARAMVS